MEPVTFILEVRRGNKVVHRMGAVPGAPSEWSSPSALADIQTPQGPLRGILIVSCIRGQEESVIPDNFPVPGFAEGL
jgi:hypothetical protein